MLIELEIGVDRLLRRTVPVLLSAALSETLPDVITPPPLAQEVNQDKQKRYYR